MSADTENTAAHEPLDEEIEEISVDVTDEGLVVVGGSDWEIELSPEEARLLADALRDAAADAESEATEEETEPAS